MTNIRITNNMITKVYEGKKLNIWKTIWVNLPTPMSNYKYNKVEKNRRKNAEKNARLVRLLTR